MVGRPRSIVALSHVMALVLICSAGPLLAQKFFPDDPLQSELPPADTPSPNSKTLNPLLDFLSNSFGTPGERQPQPGVIEALGVNTMGEVMDGAWYVARHSRKRLSLEELRRGAGDALPPDSTGPWNVLTVKAQGFRPGILIKDAKGRMYLLRFDPFDHPELTTGASIIASKFLYALGYWTPEDYIVHFDRRQLVADPEGADVTAAGRLRKLLERDIDGFLENVPRDSKRVYRALATRVPEGVPLGPFKFEGIRSDDPNDLFTHEHRRELRGLFVFSSWLNNINAHAISTLDMLVTEQRNGNPVRYIRHYFVDFGASLGSDTDRVKEIVAGNQTVFSWSSIRSNLLSLGITAPDWMKADFPDLPAVGLFECRNFDPAQWTPRFLNTPFANRLPDDEYWAARTLMTFTDEDIRTVVATAQYTDPAATAWISNCLIERRDRIGRTYFEKVLPLDGFRVEDGRLMFDDLSVKAGFVAPREFRIQWARFDNQQNQTFGIPGVSGNALPQAILDASPGDYFRAEIIPQDSQSTSTGVTREPKQVAVYMRREAGTVKVVGIDRLWPGKVVVAPRAPDLLETKTGYSDLSDKQRQLFETYAKAYSERTQIPVSAEGAWSLLSVSEETTFDAVTHALEKTELTDDTGKSLGTALSLCLRVDRIAGQYAGRTGDQQYRIYCDLRPDAREILEQATQFERDKDNTVYHANFPMNYRQDGDAPTLQFSIASDSSRADIDVDYRDSGMPSSMWNGHITSANSDVRAGDNYQRHVGRWPGMAAWWRGLFKNFQVAGSPLIGLLTQPPPPESLDLPPDRPSGANPERVEDAAQEFLTDWLQRKNSEQAMEFVSDQALRCMGEPDADPILVTSVEQGRATLLGTMRRIAGEIGAIGNLAKGIRGVEPWRPELAGALIDHPWRRAFSAFRMSTDLARGFLCTQHPALETAATAAANLTDQNSYAGTMFHFLFKEDQGGTLGLLWAREANRWKIVAYLVVRQ